jgi:zinc transport system substrate-binding protein
MKKVSIVLAIIIIGILANSLLVGCTDKEATGAELKVVASTSLITQIVERIGGDKVSVVNIIPPGQCPGHFDVKPGDIQQLADADLFLLHGWQGEQFSEELIASSGNDDLVVIQVNVQVGENANWMAPPVQAAAVDKIVEALSQVDPDNASAYESAAADYKAIITAKETEVRDKLAAINPSGINVLCADQQAGFVGWAGFNIVGVFGRPETMTVQVVKDLVDLGRSEDVVLVIDNMQSGQDAGAGVSEDLGCARVILSNFPGGYDNTSTWEDTIDYNVELLMAAVKE